MVLKIKENLLHFSFVALYHKIRQMLELKNQMNQWRHLSIFLFPFLSYGP